MRIFYSTNYSEMKSQKNFEYNEQHSGQWSPVNREVENLSKERPQIFAGFEEQIIVWSVLASFGGVTLIYNYQGQKQFLFGVDESITIKSVKSLFCRKNLFEAMSFNNFPFFWRSTTHR